MKPGLTRYRVKPIPDREYLGHPKEGDGRMDLGVPGIGVITVPMSMLIPVYPDQPADRTMVHVAGNYYQRLGLRADGKHWYMPGQQYGHTWSELCDLGTPVTSLTKETDT